MLFQAINCYQKYYKNFNNGCCVVYFMKFIFEENIKDTYLNSISKIKILRFSGFVDYKFVSKKIVSY